LCSTIPAGSRQEQQSCSRTLLGNKLLLDSKPRSGSISPSGSKIPLRSTLQLASGAGSKQETQSCNRPPDKPPVRNRSKSMAFGRRKDRSNPRFGELPGQRLLGLTALNVTQLTLNKNGNTKLHELVRVFCLRLHRCFQLHAV
jgi:hypothetical protein